MDSLKAGVLMSTFDDWNWTEGVKRVTASYCVSLQKIKAFPCIGFQKREALEYKLHPFLAAAFFGNVDVVRVLISEGNANVDFQDKSGNTALHYAIRADYPDIIKLLLEHGADCHQEKHPPMNHAVKCGNKRAVELIFSKL